MSFLKIVKDYIDAKINYQNYLDKNYPLERASSKLIEAETALLEKDRFLDNLNEKIEEEFITPTWKNYSKAKKAVNEVRKKNIPRNINDLSDTIEFKDGWDE